MFTLDLDLLAPRSVTVARCVAFGIRHKAGLHATVELIGLALVALSRAESDTSRMFLGQAKGQARRMALKQAR